MTAPRARKKRVAARVPREVHAQEHSFFFALLRREGLPLPQTELAFALSEGRKFRWDFAWVEQKVALEVQGAIWTRGAHGRGTGIARDHEKFNLGCVLGWRLLQCVPKDLNNLATIALIRRALVFNPLNLK
jgi:hypothetical protein